MNCPGANSVFLRANGKMVCWDDSGSDKILHRFTIETDPLTLFSSEGPYAAIAANLAVDTLPFPDTCPGCYCLSFRGSSSFRCGEIDVMQVEPSSTCTLRCKACATPEERSLLELPNLLTPDVFRSILGKLAESGIEIRAFDFSGHGEPMTNPDLWSLVSLAREYYPESRIFMITNGHGDFQEKHTVCGLDEIQFSIDGIDQESYEKYRVGGNFQKAFSYMKSFTETAMRNESNTRTVWRYILFEHNDSPDQLKEAFDLGSAAGVHELRFVFTHKGKWSNSITSEVQLKDCLRRRGVPLNKIRIDSQNSLLRRRRASCFLRKKPELYNVLRKLWQSIQRPSSPGIIVTADYYLVSKGEVKRAMSTARKLHRTGKHTEADLICRHIIALTNLPSKNNPDYDASFSFGTLLREVERLRTSIAAAAGTHLVQ